MEPNRSTKIPADVLIDNFNTIIFKNLPGNFYVPLVYLKDGGGFKTACTAYNNCF